MAKLNPLDTSRWTRDDFIREARLQTDAIQRLNVWLRLGYSLVAVGFLLGYGGFYGGFGVGWGIVGVVALVLGVLMSVVLKVGTTNAKKNVEALMGEAGVGLEELNRQKRAEAAAEGKKRAEARAGKVGRKMDGFTKAGEEFSGEVREVRPPGRPRRRRRKSGRTRSAKAALWRCLAVRVSGRSAPAHWLRPGATNRITIAVVYV